MIEVRAKRLIIAAVLCFVCIGSAAAQGGSKGDGDSRSAAAREEKLTSKLMAREMPYRAVLPVGYAKNKKLRYAVVYLLHGLMGQYSNWTDKTRVRAYAAKHNFIIITPEGDNGWYSDSVTKPDDRYESYIIKELIPEIDKKFRTVADREHRVIGGLSMGGYGALKFALKYPDKFVLAGSFSGALGAPSFTSENAGTIGKTVDEVFGPADSAARRENDIFRSINEMSPEKVKDLPFLYVACGTQDFLLQSNRDFMKAMFDKKARYEYRERPGGHDWEFWDDQVREFLMVAERSIKN